MSFPNLFKLTRKMTPIVLLGGFLLIITSCGEKKLSHLDEGLALYRQNKLEEALPFLLQAAEETPRDADADAWLAETYRRLGKNDQAIHWARKALDLEPCQSFAHDVLAAAYNPVYGQWSEVDSDSTWHHLLQAAACDSNDGNIWTGIWVEAIHRADEPLARKAAGRMYQTDFFTPALLAYNRWMLRHLPKDALLVTNGDMDTYPAVALQEIEGFRTDVVIANRSLLNTTWYARYLRDVYHLSLPFEDAQLDSLRPYRDEDGNLRTVSDQLIQAWMQQRQEGRFERPITISVTVGDRSFAGQTEDHLCLFGPFYSWFPVPASSPQDTAMLRISLAQIDPGDFTGSLVSGMDRSPVRRTGTDYLVVNVTYAALVYAQELIDSGRNQEALEMLAWAENFEEKTELGPKMAERIAQLRAQAQGKDE